MASRVFHDLSLSNDADFARQDETLYFEESALLFAISRWKSLDSLAAVRHAIADFKHALLARLDSLRIQQRGIQTVAMSQHYLFGELGQIVDSLTLERAQYYIDRFSKSVSEVRTGRINDINLNRWKEYEDIYTDSLWLVDRRDGSGVHRARYWGNFIPQIPYQMMRRYTKRGDWVLDTFAGSGTTLIEGQRLGRNTLGIELQQSMVEHARRLVKLEPNAHNVQIEMLHDDSVTADYQSILRGYQRSSVQLVMMHPPYFDIIKFSNDPRDLSNAPSVEDFLAQLGQLVENIVPFLEKGRYLVLVIGDKYAGGDWIPLGFLSMNEVMRRGFALKSIIVKNFEDTSGKRSQKELWRYRALAGGFYIFKHEYIFLFRKQ